MGVLEYLGLPNLGDIFNSLKPSDETSHFQFLRSLGASLLIFGIVIFIGCLLLIEYTGTGSALIIITLFGFLLMIIGSALIWHTYDDAKEFQEIEKKSKNAKASIKEAEAEAIEKEEELARQRVRAQSGHDAVPLNERGRRAPKDGKSNSGEDQPKTSGSEEAEHEK